MAYKTFCEIFYITFENIIRKYYWCKSLKKLTKDLEINGDFSFLLSLLRHYLQHTYTVRTQHS